MNYLEERMMTYYHELSMNALDSQILHFFNQFARKSESFDSAIYLVSETALLKGVVIVLVFWWFWFKEGDNNLSDRKIILSAMMGSGVAVALSRITASLLPFRQRPINHADLNFIAPFSMDPDIVESLSSFPSDHAAVYFMLATSILFLSRRAGSMILIYVFLIVCLPRVYLGDHFLTDIIGGAVLGVVIAYLFKTYKAQHLIATPLLRFLNDRPNTFYVCFFLFSYLLATNFTDVRNIGKFAEGIL